MNFQDLECWKAAREMTALSFTIVKSSNLLSNSPIKDQLLRATISTMNNIAEGYGRHSRKEHIRFFDIAVASCLEVESMTYVIEDINAITPRALSEYRSKVTRTKLLTKGYLRYLRKLN